MSTATASWLYPFATILAILALFGQSIACHPLSLQTSRDPMRARSPPLSDSI